ncbi:hypothetical protein [Kutzneria kofuensis]|uniref:Uncharacterized protein n=1 Tax=Kutzneria kofuensis TaxID=103725 RepID=A0A7W9KPX4_9PSEU|nr:hypothetical protein [Kutzneria kofuensis]MBB5896546.1 hypothetical protein [Kutzneria kofuensis]
MTGDSETELALTEFFTRFAERRAAKQELSLPDGSPPRGLAEDGLVRTTGWLQFGPRPVSSALIAAVVGLLVAIVATVAVLPVFPGISGLIPLLPTACYAFWRLLTVRLMPASSARNLATVTAQQLQAGDWVRLHGSIGPVGQVAQAEVGGTCKVTFVGGVEREWSAGDRLHLVELLD